jgi:hypothetical protein
MTSGLSHLVLSAALRGLEGNEASFSEQIPCSLSSQGCTILSGDVIIRKLAAELRPDFVVFLVSSSAVVPAYRIPTFAMFLF